MAQTILIKEVQSQSTILSLNDTQINNLFPGFAVGDFAVLYGSSAIEHLISNLCIQSQLPKAIGGFNSDVLFIDCANTFNPQKIRNIAKRQFLKEEKIFRKIHVSKTYSAYQITKLITEQLKTLTTKYNAKLIIISDMAGLFLSEDISSEDAHLVYNQLLSYLQKFAKENNSIIVNVYTKHQKGAREQALKDAILAKANVVLAIRQTMYNCDLELEKHYKYMLGVCEYSIANTTLSEFF